jgi:hypothetical protein
MADERLSPTIAAAENRRRPIETDAGEPIAWETVAWETVARLEPGPRYA